ncbi:MAG: rhomboid family intramembrane serine protease [Phycisphaerae bacterium]
MAWHRTWNEPPPPGSARGFFSRRPRRWSAVGILVLVTVAVYVLDWATGYGIILPLGALSVNSLARLQLWRLVTYQFLHGGFWHIGINMLILWMLGRHIEQGLGRKRFCYLYLLSGVVGGLCQVAFNVLMTRWYGPAVLDHATVGASGSVMGVLMAFAVLHPRQELYVFIFFFPLRVEARWFALGYFILESVYAWQALTLGLVDNVAHAAHLGGLGVGFVWMKFGDRVAAWWRYHKGPAGSQHTSQSRGREAKEETKEEAKDEAEVDRILRKIHEEGIDSLTPREKMFLQDVSRRRGGRP